MQKKKRVYLPYLGLVILIIIALPLWSVWLIIHPDNLRHGSSTPEDIGAQYEVVTLPVSDGTTLTGWYIPAPEKTTRSIILIHGYTHDKATMLSVAEALHSEFNLFVVDLRYHGESGGLYSTFGVRERIDMQYAVTFLEERGAREIGILGYSLGAATALMTAGSDPRIDAVVAYAPFASIMLLADEAYDWLGIARAPFIGMMEFWARLFFGANPREVSPIALAHRITAPVLHIHSQSDDLIPFENATMIHEALTSSTNVEVWYPARGAHVEIPFKFNDRVRDFFVRELK